MRRASPGGRPPCGFKENLTVEHRGPLSHYDVEFLPGTERPHAVTPPLLFETAHVLPAKPLRLFRLGALREAGWLKALRLDEYAPRRPRRPEALQQTLLPA